MFSGESGGLLEQSHRQPPSTPILGHEEAGDAPDLNLVQRRQHAGSVQSGVLGAGSHGAPTHGARAVQGQEAGRHDTPGDPLSEGLTVAVPATGAPLAGGPAPPHAPAPRAGAARTKESLQFWPVPFSGRGDSNFPEPGGFLHGSRGADTRQVRGSEETPGLWARFGLIGCAPCEADLCFGPP